MKMLLNNAFLILLLSFTGCLTVHKTPGGSALKAFSLSGFAQGTTYHITYYAPDSIVAKRQIDSLLENIDSSLSIYKPYSLITSFNNAEKEMQMDKHLKTVVARSLKISRETKGVSDITVYPLMALWGFGPIPGAPLPGKADVEKVLPCVGSGKLSINGNRLIKALPCLKIDVNGIAQGYSVDVISFMLERKKIHNYLVELGGEIKIKGRKYPGKSMLRIGIETPASNIDDAPVLRKIIEVKNGAVTTSGNYRKYHEANGRRVTHLLSPFTGYPFNTDLVSVTVWARDAITADAYDNALMGMGLQGALVFLQRRNDLQAYFIYQDSNGIIRDTATTGFYKMFK